MRHARDGWFHVEPERARFRVVLLCVIAGPTAAAAAMLLLVMGLTP